MVFTLNSKAQKASSFPADLFLYYHLFTEDLTALAAVTREPLRSACYLKSTLMIFVIKLKTPAEKISTCGRHYKFVWMWEVRLFILYNL